MLIGSVPELVPRAVLGDGVNGIGGQVRLSQRSNKRPQHDGALALLDLVLWRLNERPRLHRNRSEEHTSELQSRENLVCRLLLEKKKSKKMPRPPHDTKPGVFRPESEGV